MERDYLTIEASVKDLNRTKSELEAKMSALDADFIVSQTLHRLQCDLIKSYQTAIDSLERWRGSEE